MLPDSTPRGAVAGVGRALARAVTCRGALVAAFALITTACTVGERPTLTDEGIGTNTIPDGGAAAETVGGGVDSSDDGTTGSAAPSSTSGTSSESTSAEVAALEDLAALGDAPPVVVTATGIPVPVLGRTDTGFVVNTPCGNPDEIIWGQPVGPVDVVLDPGHGGDEAGALGPNGETEAEVNLDVARRTAAMLERQGITVALTRTGDYRTTIPNRAAIADRLEAQAFVSIHHNSPTPSAPNADAGTPGTEVYPQLNSDDASRLGGLLYAEVVAALSQFDVEWAAATNAGVLRVVNNAGENAYGIVRRPSVPTALVELAYLSNPSEAVVIGTTDYRDTASIALSRAIVRYLTTEDEGSGFVDEPRLTDPPAETGGSDDCVDPALE